MLGRRCAHHEPWRRARQDRRREGHRVRGPPREADDDLVVGVHVDQPAGGWFVTDVAVHTGELQPARRDCAFEAELQQHVDQGGPRRTVHQQIQVSRTSQPAVPLGMPLPLTVGDAGALQGAGEPLDERRRGRTGRRAGLLGGRHGAATSLCGRESALQFPPVAPGAREWPAGFDSPARPRSAARQARAGCPAPSDAWSCRVRRRTSP